MARFHSIVARLLPSRQLTKHWSADELSGLHLGEVGELGEDLAVDFLRRDGFKILYRNFRAPHGGEADVVCREGTILVFVEVKTRRSERFGRPADAVDDEKRRLLTRGAAAWLRMITPKPIVRFDIVEVTLLADQPAKINCIKDAFQTPDDYFF